MLLGNALFQQFLRGVDEILYINNHISIYIHIIFAHGLVTLHFVPTLVKKTTTLTLCVVFKDTGAYFFLLPTGSMVMLYLPTFTLSIHPSKVPILRTQTPAIQVPTPPLEGPRILRVPLKFNHSWIGKYTYQSQGSYGLVSQRTWVEFWKNMRHIDIYSMVGMLLPLSSVGSVALLIPQLGGKIPLIYHLYIAWGVICYRSHLLGEPASQPLIYYFPP